MKPLNKYLPPESVLAKRARDELFPGKEILSIPITASGPAGQCYGNVKERVKQRGGSEVYGWLLTVWPDKFVKALHHSVWRNPNGGLEDITAYAFPDLRGKSSTFIVDDSTEIRTDVFDPSIPSKFFQLAESAEIRQYIDATQKAANLRASMSTLLSQDGVEVYRSGAHMQLMACPAEIQDKYMQLQNQMIIQAALKNQYCAQLNGSEQKTQSANSLCQCGSGKKFKRCHGK